jgi:hypothetical protein
MTVLINTFYNLKYNKIHTKHAKLKYSVIILLYFFIFLQTP